LKLEEKRLFHDGRRQHQVAVDHNTDIGRMIEKLVEDDLKKCPTCGD
jgi:hypothetical protein